MEYCSRYGGVIAVYLALIAISIVSQSDGRELRPSDHGLIYQDTPPATGENSTEMLSFFGRPESNVPLPEARNMSDPSSWSSDGGGGRGDGGGRDHVRDVLLVASLACGVTGVVLLIVGAFVFLFRFRKQYQSSSTPLPQPPPPLLALDYNMYNLNKEIKISNDDV